MIRALVLALGLVLGLSVAAPFAMAQQSTPAAAIARFVELANSGGLASPEGRALLAGEAEAAATGAVSALPAADKILTISPDKAVARMVLKSPQGQESDIYFYLDRTGRAWRVSAFRQMALTEISFILLREMNKQTTLSSADQDEKRNLELVLSSDAQLRTWFGANRSALDALAATPANDPGLAARLKAIGVGAIERKGGDVVLTIGGMVDNTVGFLRAGPSGPPAISPSDHIWVESLGDNWYLFRTT